MEVFKIWCVTIPTSVRRSALFGATGCVHKQVLHGVVPKGGLNPQFNVRQVRVPVSPMATIRPTTEPIPKKENLGNKNPEFDRCTQFEVERI